VKNKKLTHKIALNFGYVELLQLQKSYIGSGKSEHTVLRQTPHI